MKNSIELIAPDYRSHPDAQAFADVLAERLPDWSVEMGSYAWEAPIPTRESWESEADALAEHLAAL